MGKERVLLGLGAGGCKKCCLGTSPKEKFGILGWFSEVGLRGKTTPRTAFGFFHKYCNLFGGGAKTPLDRTLETKSDCLYCDGFSNLPATQAD